MSYRVLLAATCMIATVSIAFDETFEIRIVKVEGTKVTYQRYQKAQDKAVIGETVTKEVAKDVVVTRGSAKQFESKTATVVEDGLKNPAFNILEGKSRPGHIIIADSGPDKGKIIAININLSGPPK